MGDFSLHGITVPEKYGGLSLGYLYHCISLEEISRASVEERNTCTEGEVFAKAYQWREHVGALAMSEPNAGSDVVSMKCKADRVDGGYVLNGNKM